MQWYTSKHINRITKQELYEALKLVSDRGYNKNYKELAYMVEEAGLFDDPNFPYDQESFKTARVFKGRAARALFKALDLKIENDDVW